MAIPTIQAVGTPNSGTAAVTYTLPAHQANDLLLLFVECAESAGVTAPSGGWAHITNSPRPQGSNVTCVNVMWLRASGSGTTNPQVADPGNHQVGVAVVVRGALASGDPFDFAPVGDGAAGATSFSADPGTTTVADCRVFIGIAGNTDTTSDQWSSVANATLSSFTEHEQFYTDDGNGGGIGVYSGGKATTGSTGNTTGNMATQTWSALTFAVKPSTGSQDETGTGTLSGSGTLTASGAPAFAETASLSGSGTLTASGAPAPTGTASLSGSGSLTTGTTLVVTNLIRNPSLESATAGYGWAEVGTDMTGARSTSVAFVRRTGAAGFRSVVSGSAPAGIVWSGTAGAGVASSSSAPVVAGSVYSGGIYVRGPSGASTAIAIQWYTSGGSFISFSSFGSSVSLTASWQRATVLNVTAPATAAYAIVRSETSGLVGDSGDEMGHDDAMIVDGATLPAYFDGDTANGDGYTYAWTGTASNSTSTRTEGADNVPGFIQSASLSGSGTLTGAQTAVTVSGTASLSGSGTLAGTQDAVTASGSATLSGSGTLTAAGTPDFAGTATLSGSGTLTGTQVEVTASGAAALSGSGALTAAGAPAFTDAAALSGSGTLTASGGTIESYTGSASLSGSGTLTAAGLGYKNIAFSASGSTTAVNVTSTMTINISTAAVGSMVYAWGSWGGDPTSVTSPGWTFLVDDEIAAGGGGNPNHYFLARRLKLAGDSTFVFTSNGDTGKGAMGWVAYTNVDTATPEEQLTARESATTNQSTIPTNSATPTAANRWALATYSMRNASDSTNTFTPASGLTERVDVTNGSGAAPWMSIEIADSNGVVTQASHSYTADNTLLTSQSASVLLYLRPAPIVVEFTGSGSLSGSGTLTASGAPAFSRTVALSGSGTLTAAGTPAPVAAASLSGSGSLSTTQTSVVVSGVAALSGTGTLSAQGTPATSGSATLSGSGTLTASGSLGFDATAALSGSGTLAASGVPRPVAAVPLEGTGTLVAAGTPAVTQQVALSGAGSLAATGSLATTGSATLSGSGSLAATGTPHPLAGGISATITNLVPNPSAEVNRVGWNSSGGSFTRDNTVGITGSWSFRLQSTGAFGTPVEMHSEADARYPVTAGLTYAVSAAATGPATGDGSYSMSVAWYDGSTLLETTSPVTVASITNARADLVLIPTAPVGATGMRINLSGVSATNAPIYFDSIQVTEGATLYPYFDGSAPDDSTYTYSWTSTAHNSPSTRVLTAGSVPLTGSGTLTPTGTQAITGATAALTGSGVLEVTGTDMTVTSFVPLTGTGTLQAFAVDVHQAALSGLGTLLGTGVAQFETYDITVTGRLIRGHQGYLINAPSRGRLLAPASSGRIEAPTSSGGVFRTEDGVLLL